jgi:hypothetical protein
MIHTDQLYQLRQLRLSSAHTRVVYVNSLGFRLTSDIH